MKIWARSIISRCTSDIFILTIFEKEVISPHFISEKDKKRWNELHDMWHLLPEVMSKHDKELLSKSLSIDGSNLREFEEKVRFEFC